MTMSCLSAQVTVTSRLLAPHRVDEIVLSLYAEGLTTGEIGAHFAEIYGASVSKGDDLPDHRQGVR
jgi:Transposase, Mutator family